MSETIKDKVYSMSTPEILSEAKSILEDNGIEGWNFKSGKYVIKDKIKALQISLEILKEAEYRKDLRNIFGNMNIGID